MTIKSHQNETELLNKIAAGDHHAFNEIHELLFADLFRSAYNVIRDRDACMDVVQEVLVWFWEHREHHRITSLKGYLLMAVKYQVSNYIRRGKVRENYRLAHIEQEFVLSEESLELQELKSMIEKFTNDLPEKCKEIFQMSREQHLSNKEIAVKLNISEKTVSVQISRALQKLRKDLGKMNFWMYFFM
ncbi:RNA polymerase sigma-70 factor [Pedobacter nutrimenti]|uniref:RNA polymerase sigma-70 factor n=1 Tax=Pedobacter nutrimenti TaxID=1241337 RepID=UPI00292E08B7|nr:RNA polymerase sigma-70 factor [Pedobacter nutrimenti]